MQALVFWLRSFWKALRVCQKNRNNAEELIKLDIFRTFAKIIEQNTCESEVKWTLMLIWSLSFRETSQEKIKGLLIGDIKLLFTSENPELMRSAKGILFEFGLIECNNPKAENEQDESSPNKAASVSGERDNSGIHVMISYCGAQQDVAIQLNDRLKKAGKKVWIDEKLEGDSLINGRSHRKIRRCYLLFS